MLERPQPETTDPIDALPLDRLESMLDTLVGARRRRRYKAHSRFEPYKGDPVAFVEEVLLGFLWSKQKLICESVVANRRTAVPSCHDSGKSFVLSRIAAYWVSVHPPGEALVITLAPTWPQVRNIIWREINKAHAAGGLPGRCNQTEWWIDPEIVAFGRSPDDNDPTAIQGGHARYVLVILDEAGGISKTLIDAADSLVANDDSRMVMIGNPDDPTTEFARVCLPGSGWNVIEIDGFDTPNFSGEKIPDDLRHLLLGKTWVEEKIKSWGEYSPIYQSKIRGKFPDQASDALVPLSALQAAVNRGLSLNNEIGTDDPNELGVDVARFGDDKSVIFHRRGNVARRYWEARKRDLMTLVGTITTAITDTGAKRVKIDDLGMGGGVVDRLHELQGEGKIASNVEIIGVVVSRSPIDTQSDERFRNLRAELNWGMRMRFVEGRVTLLGDTDDLISQASQIKYKFESGELRIERKDEMKKRLKGISPDDWDALVLCFSDALTGAEAWIEHFKKLAQKAPAAPVESPADNRPWQKPRDKAKVEPTSDLVELYRQTFMAAIGANPTLCKICGKPLGATRVSDGVDAWHPPGGCY